MSTIAEQLEQVEVSIEQAKEAITNKEALDKLTANPDFKKVVLEGYFEKEASRLVLLKADPSMQDEKEQSQIDKSINAIGYVRLYFHTIMQLGLQMERTIAEDEKTREELLSEEL